MESEGQLLDKDAIVKTFIKMESTTSLTDCRNISPRTDEFLSIIGPYISSVEHYLHDAPFLVKGINLPDRDKRMTKLLDYHTYLETDYSRFDMTISHQWLECVQDPLLLLFFEESTQLREALMLARKTSGVSSYGLKYDIVGTRCSGDAHTSIGNGLINAFNTWMIYSDIPEDEICAFHEGDDGIVGFTSDYADCANRVYIMDSLGFKVKAFITQDITQATFCGRYLAEDGGSLLSYCDPYRTLSKLHITFSNGQLPMLLLAKCLSYRYTDGATPIIGPIVKTLVKLLQSNNITNSKYSKINIKSSYRHAMANRWVMRLMENVDLDQYSEDVDERLRVPFAIRTGINPTAQRRIESYYVQMFSKYIPESFDKIPAMTEIILELEDRIVHYMPTLHMI